MWKEIEGCTLEDLTPVTCNHWLPSTCHNATHPFLFWIQVNRCHNYMKAFNVKGNLRMHITRHETSNLQLLTTTHMWQCSLSLFLFWIPVNRCHIFMKIFNVKGDLRMHIRHETSNLQSHVTMLLILFHSAYRLTGVTNCMKDFNVKGNKVEK